MEKPSAALVAVFDELVVTLPGAERRPMFGQVSAFLNGNMFLGLFEEGVIARLPADGRAEAEAEGAQPFAPMGRVMREYVLLPPAVVADRDALRAWAERAYAFALTLPPKEPKGRGGKKTR
jgi:TfoX/Sxy family transcriptional regulator of competence genes